MTRGKLAAARSLTGVWERQQLRAAERAERRQRHEANPLPVGMQERRRLDPRHDIYPAQRSPEGYVRWRKVRTV